jgi:hypothetical protein
VRGERLTAVGGKAGTGELGHRGQVRFVKRPPRQRRHLIFHGQTLRTRRQPCQPVSSLEPAGAAWYERKKPRIAVPRDPGCEEAGQ